MHMVLIYFYSCVCCSSFFCIDDTCPLGSFSTNLPCLFCFSQRKVQNFFTRTGTYYFCRNCCDAAYYGLETPLQYYFHLDDSQVNNQIPCLNVINLATGRSTLFSLWWCGVECLPSLALAGTLFFCLNDWYYPFFLCFIIYLCTFLFNNIVSFMSASQST